MEEKTNARLKPRRGILQCGLLNHHEREDIIQVLTEQASASLLRRSTTGGAILRVDETSVDLGSAP